MDSPRPSSLVSAQSAEPQLGVFCGADNGLFKGLGFQQCLYSDVKTGYKTTTLPGGRLSCRPVY